SSGSGVKSKEGTLIVNLKGEAVGQVNGLSFHHFRDSAFSPDSAVEMTSGGGASRVRRGANRWQGAVGIAGVGAPAFFGLRQVPVQLRRNGETLAQGPQPPEKLGALLPRDRTPDLEASGLGNQIGPDQEHQIPDRPQAALHPTRRQDRLPKSHQEV